MGRSSRRGLEDQHRDQSSSFHPEHVSEPSTPTQRSCPSRTHRQQQNQRQRRPVSMPDPQTLGRRPSQSGVASCSSSARFRQALFTHWIPSQRRQRTYPPVSRVLKNEIRRFTRQRQSWHSMSLPRRRQTPRKRKRQSLRDILNAFHQASSTPLPYSSVRSSMYLQRPDHSTTRASYVVHLAENRHGGQGDSSQQAQASSMAVANKSITRATKSPTKLDVPPLPILSLNRYPTISTLSSLSSVERCEKQHKAATTTCGHAGTRVIWHKIHKSSTDGSTQYLLFTFGFLFFPLWWVGAFFYFTFPLQPMSMPTMTSFITPRTAGRLNCWMSALSIILISLLIAMGIWYQRTT